jgi:hypothetical protein
MDRKQLKTGWHWSLLFKTLQPGSMACLFFRFFDSVAIFYGLFTCLGE